MHRMHTGCMLLRLSDGRCETRADGGERAAYAGLDSLRWMMIDRLDVRHETSRDWYSDSAEMGLTNACDVTCVDSHIMDNGIW